jgi:hypothetical protein
MLLPGLASGMVFKPPHSRMWDVWCYYHDETWYLYYLAASQRRGWDSVEVATSKNGVHWKWGAQCVHINDKREGGLGNLGFGTGYTWKSPWFERDRKFLGNFTITGDQRKGISSFIRFVESADLVAWRHLDVEFRPDPRWYKEDYRWDCIKSLPRPGGGYFGYWTAAPKDGRVGFGIGETDDGVHWRALPPPVLDWSGRPPQEEVEVGGVEKIGDKYYALLTAFTRSKNEYHVTTFSAEKPEGPFRAAAKNFHPIPGLHQAWFPGFFPSPDGMLVAHHVLSATEQEKGRREVYMAPLKRAHVDREGTLRFAWWQGNEALKGEVLETRLNREAGPKSTLPAFFNGCVDLRRGVIVEGIVEFPEAPAAPVPGLLVESEEGTASAIRFLSASATVGGSIEPDGSGFTADVQQQVDRELPTKSPVRFRLLVRRDLLELYFDNVLMNVFSLPKPASGRIGFLSNATGISDLRTWTMTLPEK